MVVRIESTLSDTSIHFGANSEGGSRGSDI